MSTGVLPDRVPQQPFRQWASPAASGCVAVMPSRQRLTNRRFVLHSPGTPNPD